MDPRKTENAPADDVALALSPALIMTLVGSLVFFLLEILYAGAYTARLQWTLFFFVFGAVLIARISMEPALAGRASFYGGILGLLVWIGLLMYVEYPADSAVADIGWAINLGLILLIWWCAHQLTWDCTFMDDRVGASGKGVLQAAGFEDGGRPEADEPGEEEEKEDPRAKNDPLNWLERYRRYRQQRGLKRTPGVWVVYFSLAALPIFGLGQTLIPVDETGRRRYTFWLMAGYIGSGLGLLLTTTFLGLRTYLRRRKLKMPVAMTGVWLTLGGALIALLLLGGALLPRPQAEYKAFEFGSAGSKSRQASRHNVKRGDGGEGKGEAQEGKDSREKRQGKEKGQDGGEKGDKDGKKDSDGSADKKDKAQQDGGKDKDGKKDGADSKEKQANKEKDEKKTESEEKTSTRDSAKPPPPERSSFSWKGLAKILKWVVFGLLALVAAFFAIRAVLQFFANFTDWARNLLDALRNFWASLLGLFGRKNKEEEAAGAEEEQRAAIVTQPFASFSNPFTDGREGQLSTPELIRYTFAALQAWAAERDLGRQPGETPLEFGGRLGEEVPPLARDVQRFALLYARAVYGQGALPANSREGLAQFWETLLRTAAQPLSA